MFALSFSFKNPCEGDWFSFWCKLPEDDVEVPCVSSLLVEEDPFRKSFSLANTWRAWCFSNKFVMKLLTLEEGVLGFVTIFPRELEGLRLVEPRSLSLERGGPGCSFSSGFLIKKMYSSILYIGKYFLGKKRVYYEALLWSHNSPREFHRFFVR